MTIFPMYEHNVVNPVTEHWKLYMTLHISEQPSNGIPI
jgi:hypothetical protein